MISKRMSVISGSCVGTAAEAVVKAPIYDLKAQLTDVTGFFEVAKSFLWRLCRYPPGVPETKPGPHCRGDRELPASLEVRVRLYF